MEVKSKYTNEEIQKILNDFMNTKKDYEDKIKELEKELIIVENNIDVQRQEIIGKFSTDNVDELKKILSELYSQLDVTLNKMQNYVKDQK